MTIKTVYPTAVSQSSGAPYRQFENLNNIKDGSSSYARSKNISGGISSKAGTYHTPARIISLNFKANIPTNAIINSVTVDYRAKKEGYIGIGKIGVDLEGLELPGIFGSGLTDDMTTYSVKFTSPKLTPSIVNSSQFGVTLYFPKNSTYNTGYVRVKFVRINIDYTLPNYSIVARKVSGEYTDEEYLIQAEISNINKTNSDSNVTITLPSGATYKGISIGDGSITSNGQTLTWTPGLTDKLLNRSVVFKVQFSSVATYSIGFKEGITGHTSTVSITPSERPSPVIEPDEDNETVYIEPEVEVTTLTIKQGTPFMVNYTLTSEQLEEFTTIVDDWNGGYLICSNPNFSDNIRSFNTNTGEYEYDYDSIVDSGYVHYDTDGVLQYTDWDIEDDDANGKFRINATGQFTLVLIHDWDSVEDNKLPVEFEVARINIYVYPSTLTTPSISILQLTQEELDRLGNGYTYTVQSYLKEITNDTYVRDWGRNFRIGVFNNHISTNLLTLNTDNENETVIDSTDYTNLTTADIFNYAEYWSGPLTAQNTYESLTVNFPYQEQYPLYILITGDYVEANPQAEIKFTEPVITETSDYKGPTPNGNYPIPIMQVIRSGDTSQLTIPSFGKCDTFIAYDSPVENIITDKYFIKGVKISFDIDYTDYISLNIKLNTGKGIGERSLILTPGEVGTYTLGGPNDRWNLTPGQLVHPEDWEFQITYTNVFNNDNSSSEVFFNNAVITYYIQEIEEQTISILVEGENLAIYDTFITDIEIPAGLKTDTDLIDIKGTDLNDAYLQTIREKTITINLTVTGCDLYESTRALQELTSLLTNERDELNRPIPKRLDVSTYPDIHWEYVMKDPIDAEVDITDYECKIKLLIPSGTAYTNEEILTSTVGKVDGIAKINPKIQLIPLNNSIEITERYSGQKFTMKHPSWTTNDTVVIDCINRTVTLNDTSDITGYVDYDADWFKLYGEFEFQPINCIIQTVSRHERM